ncbi:hypothetical protein V6Z11_D06G198300 [Gossypium hirsutum]
MHGFQAIEISAISFTQGVTCPPQSSGIKLNIAARGFPFNFNDSKCRNRRSNRSGLVVEQSEIDMCLRVNASNSYQRRIRGKWRRGLSGRQRTSSPIPKRHRINRFLPSKNSNWIFKRKSGTLFKSKRETD